MIRYVIKRLLLMIPVIICVAVLIFTIMYFVPGDPAEIILGPTATQQELEAYREILGLNQPFLLRLGNYLRDVFLRFDFGTSYIDGTSVTANILSRLPRTLIIAVGSMLFAMVTGVFLGIYAAVHQNGAADRISMFIALFGISMPGFWLALMLVLLFSVRLNWLPSFGIGGVKYYVLPWIATSMPEIARIARQSRSSMLEVIRSDYITTAKAKGVRRREVILRHALPNALIPIITTVGNGLAHGMGGALIIEAVFSIPGLGLYIVNGINNRDYVAVQSTIVFFSIMFSLIQLAIDLVYAAVDPRIKAAFSSGSLFKARKARKSHADEK